MTKHRGNFASVESIAARLGAERISAMRAMGVLEKPPTPEQRRRIASDRAAFVDVDAPIDPERVRRQLRQSRQMPLALKTPCAAHGAEIDAPCWGRAGQNGAGVCHARLARADRRWNFEED